MQLLPAVKDSHPSNTCIRDTLTTDLKSGALTANAVIRMVLKVNYWRTRGIWFIFSISIVLQAMWTLIRPHITVDLDQALFCGIRSGSTSFVKVIFLCC